MIYYHELGETIRGYLRQEGSREGLIRLLAMIYCAGVDVEIEENNKAQREKEKKDASV